MRSLLITSRRERSTGLVNPSVFHILDQLMCISGTSQQALSTTMGVAFAVGRQVRQFSFTMTREARKPCPKRLRASLPLSHATVLVGFPRKVSDRLRGLLLSTSPFSERNPTRAYATHHKMPTVAHAGAACGAPFLMADAYSEEPSRLTTSIEGCFNNQAETVSTERSGRRSMGKPNSRSQMRVP
jgi:hypothetical protein